MRAHFKVVTALAVLISWNTCFVSNYGTLSLACAIGSSICALMAFTRSNR